MDWANIVIAGVTSLCTGLVAFGAAKSRLENLATISANNSATIQAVALKQANDVNELRREAYNTYVTQRQFEAYVDSTKDQLHELRMDVKKLLELVAAGKNL